MPFVEANSRRTAPDQVSVCLRYLFKWIRSIHWQVSLMYAWVPVGAENVNLRIVLWGLNVLFLTYFLFIHGGLCEHIIIDFPNLFWFTGRTDNRCNYALCLPVRPWFRRCLFVKDDSVNLTGRKTDLSVIVYISPLRPIGFIQTLKVPLCHFSVAEGFASVTQLWKPVLILQLVLGIEPPHDVLGLDVLQHSLVVDDVALDLWALDGLLAQVDV